MVALHPHSVAPALDQPMLSITINGEPARVAAQTSIAALLAERGQRDKRVAVERNGAIVPKSRHADTVVVEADCLEIVVAVGGG